MKIQGVRDEENQGRVRSNESNSSVLRSEERRRGVGVKAEPAMGSIQNPKLDTFTGLRSGFSTEKCKLRRVYFDSL